VASAVLEEALFGKADYGTVLNIGVYRYKAVTVVQNEFSAK
jgi:hypothetical protein